MIFNSFLSRVAIVLAILCVLFGSVSAGFFDDFISSWTPDVRYCNDAGECGLDEWIDVIKDGISDLETDRTASDYIQDIVIYLLGFVTILWVIYIIYAGFMIVIWNGDDEKLKNSKQIIIYVVVWITVMWLAYPIMSFVIGILNA